MTQPDPPIFPYATPGDVGVPDNYPPVEEMIDRRCRPKDIRVHFRKAGHAIEYFCRSMQRRYAIEKVGHVCEVCGGVCDSYAAMGWAVEMPKRRSELTQIESSPRNILLTHHALCGRCYGRWRRRMRRVNWVRLLAILGLVGGIIWLFVARRWYAGGSLVLVLMPSGLLLACVAALGFANWIARLATPAPIRRRLPPGLSAEALGDLSPRGQPQV